MHRFFLLSPTTEHLSITAAAAGDQVNCKTPDCSLITLFQEAQLSLQAFNRISSSSVIKTLQLHRLTCRVQQTGFNGQGTIYFLSKLAYLHPV